MRELPGDRLTVSLGSVAPAFGSVRTNAVTVRYLGDIVDCVRAHPASRVAVIPDNPGIYPILGLRNPLPADCLWPSDLVGNVDVVDRAIVDLDARGDYLVMVQSVDAGSVAGLPSLPHVPPDATASMLFTNPGPSPAVIAVTELRGARISCGSFLGIYSPAANAATQSGSAPLRASELRFAHLRAWARPAHFSGLAEILRSRPGAGDALGSTMGDRRRGGAPSTL